MPFIPWIAEAARVLVRAGRDDVKRFAQRVVHRNERATVGVGPRFNPQHRVCAIDDLSQRVTSVFIQFV